MRKAASFHVLLLFANLSLTVGCSSHTGGYFSETKLPIFSYIRTSLASNGRSGKLNTFPIVQVYDSNGRLVYRDGDAENIVGTIDRLSAGSFVGTAIPNSISLAEVIRQLPATRIYKAPGHEKLTIIVVSLEGCQGCTVVDGALSQKQNGILAQGDRLIVVHIQQPP